MENYEPGELDFVNESVVITDPCDIIPKIERGFADVDAWAKCGYGDHMENIGFTKFMTRRNGYGDGGWTVVNEKTGKVLGEIWADSGQAGVYLRDEIKKYNPDANIFFPSITGGKFGAIILENFTGKISWKYRMEHYNWDGREVDSYYLVLSASGKCGDEDTEFSVDFGGKGSDEEE